jgi:hypothetical protein
MQNQAKHASFGEGMLEAHTGMEKQPRGNMQSVNVDKGMQ